MSIPKQSAGRGDDFFGCDAKQAGIRSARMRKGSAAGGISQHDASRAVWTVACGIRWTENRNHRDLQSGSEMQRPGISANEQARAARKRDQFADRARHRTGLATACGQHLICKLFFAWA